MLLRPNKQELASCLCIPGNGFELNSDGLPLKILRKNLLLLLKLGVPFLFLTWPPPHENIKDRAGYPLSHTCIFKKCIHIEVGHFMKKMYEEERFYHPTKTYIGKANIVFKGAIYSIYLVSNDNSSFRR